MYKKKKLRHLNKHESRFIYICTRFMFSFFFLLRISLIHFITVTTSKSTTHCSSSTYLAHLHQSQQYLTVSFLFFALPVIITCFISFNLNTSFFHSMLCSPIPYPTLIKLKIERSRLDSFNTNHQAHLHHHRHQFEG